MQYNILGRYFARTEYFYYAHHYLPEGHKNFSPGAKNENGLKTPLYLDWRSRLPILLRACEEVNADIICLSEVDDYEGFRAALKGRYDSYFAPRSLKRNDGEAVFWDRSKLLLRAARRVVLSTRSERVTAVCEFSLKERYGSVTVVATHLYWNGSSEVQQEEVTSILHLLGDIKTPTLVAGDFNSTRNSRTFTRLTEFGLQDVFEKGNISKPNYTSCIPATHSLHSDGKWRRNSGRKEEIDFIFVNKEIKVINAWVHEPKSIFTGNLTEIDAKNRSGVKEEGIPNAESASDHLPVVADVCI